jgi:hypothetical protein
MQAMGSSLNSLTDREAILDGDMRLLRIECEGPLYHVTARLGDLETNVKEFRRDPIRLPVPPEFPSRKKIAGAGNTVCSA